MKTWVWTEKIVLNNYIMLIVEDSDGSVHGIRFDGSLSDERSVELNIHSAKMSTARSWKVFS